MVKPVDERLQRYLTLPSESSPVWLDEGRTLAYVRRDDSGTHIWQLDLETGERRRRTTRDTRVWSIASQPLTGDLFYALDEDGHECEQLYRLRAEGDAPQALTKLPAVRHFWGGVSPDGQTLAYASNERRPETFDIWTQDLTSGQKQLVREHGDNYNWPPDGALSPDGRYLLYNKLRGESDNPLWITDLRTGDSWRVPEDERLSAETTPAWQHDSQAFYLLSDRSGEFNQVCRYQLATRRLETVVAYDWDVSGLALSADDRYLAVFVNEAGSTVLRILDLWQSASELNTVRPPQGVLSPYEQAAWSPRGHKLLFSLSSGSRPQGLWLLDLDRESLRRISEDEVLEEDRQLLVEPKLGRYTSFDGLAIDYWLYVPQEKKVRDLPVVIEIHGGPEGQETSLFNPFIQYLVAAGFAVVAPNVRGSTGYGKTFTHLDDVEKRLDSVRDIDSLVAHLIAEGIADSERIAVMGMSYGGFMTLSVAARYPRLWACAISTVGMYNLVTFLENTADYRRAHRESEYGSLEHHRELLYEVSPAAKIRDITAPMMIVQGKNDPRVPVSEAEQAVEALREMGREVDYLVYDDEGHGIRKLKNQLDCYPKMAEFLGRHLL